MDDDKIQSAIETGQRNLRASALLSNWCRHAEIFRTAGRGLVEQTTGFAGQFGIVFKQSTARFGARSDHSGSNRNSRRKIAFLEIEGARQLYYRLMSRWMKRQL